MLHEDDDETEAPVRRAYRGWCIVQVHADGSLTSQHTECEPWREWRNVLMHASLETALARCQPGSVIVEVDGYGDDYQNVCIARLGTEAPLGQPRAMWAVCGDDLAAASGACEAHGIACMGVVASIKVHQENQKAALWKFDREFRSQCKTTKWCMPRVHPNAPGALLALALVIVAGTIMWWVMTLPTLPAVPAESNPAAVPQTTGTQGMIPPEPAQTQKQDQKGIIPADPNQDQTLTQTQAQAQEGVIVDPSVAPADSRQNLATP